MSFAVLVCNGGHHGRQSSRTFTIQNAHQAFAPADHRLLGRMDRVDSRRHGFRHLCPGAQSRTERTASQVRLQGHACNRRIRGIRPVCAIPGRLGPVDDLGADRRSLWPHARACCHDLCLCRLYRRGRAVANRMATRIVSVARRNRNWRRMGSGRNLRRRGVAGRSPQDGRRISADGILCRLLSGFGFELHSGRPLRMACHVLVRPHAGSGCLPGALPRE